MFKLLNPAKSFKFNDALGHKFHKTCKRKNEVKGKLNVLEGNTFKNCFITSKVNYSNFFHSERIF